MRDAARLEAYSDRVACPQILLRWFCTDRQQVCINGLLMARHAYKLLSLSRTHCETNHLQQWLSLVFQLFLVDRPSVFLGLSW